MSYSLPVEGEGQPRV